MLLEGDDAASAAVYACGPPAMLEAVRAMCAERGVACELAMEAPMACGYGACFGCAVPLAAGGYMRLCVDGPVVRGDEIETALVPGSGTDGVNGGNPGSAPGPEVDLCGIELAHPVINGSGTYDAIAARRVFGDALLERFPSPPSSPRRSPRSPGPATRRRASGRRPSGLVNSIGLPNKGLDGFLDMDLPLLAELPVPLIVSVMATSHDEFARLVEAVAGRDEVAALELNVSCPNVKSGLIVGESPEEAARCSRLCAR